MSSKSAESTTETRATWPFSRSWSITGRLTVLYTVSAGGLLLLATMFLYWVLASNLTREDHQFLADKVHVLRGILRDHPWLTDKTYQARSMSYVYIGPMEGRRVHPDACHRASMVPQALSSLRRNHGEHTLSV